MIKLLFLCPTSQLLFKPSRTTLILNYQVLFEKLLTIHGNLHFRLFVLPITSTLHHSQPRTTFKVMCIFRVFNKYITVITVRFSHLNMFCLLSLFFFSNFPQIMMDLDTFMEHIHPMNMDTFPYHLHPLFPFRKLSKSLSIMK